MIAIRSTHRHLKASTQNAFGKSVREQGETPQTDGPVEFFEEPCFRKRNAAKLIGEAVPASESTRKSVAPSGLPSYLNHLWTVPLLSMEQEQYYFRRLNFLKFQLVKRLPRSGKRPTRGKSLAVCEQLECDIVATRNFIIESNLRLVVSLAKKFASGNQGDFDEFVSVGNAAMIRAVERFDYRRGFRFSTYAYQAIQRSIFDVFQKDRRVRDKFIPDGNDAVIDSVQDAGEIDRIEITAAENKSNATELISHLDDREQRIVKAHFGIVRGTEPSSLRVIGDELGLSKQRIRQLLIRAIEKMQVAARRAQIVPS